MLLSIDIGNTDAVFGLFDGESLIQTWRMPTIKVSDKNKWIDGIKTSLVEQKIDVSTIQNIAFANVVPSVDDAFQLACKEVFNCPAPFSVSMKCELNIDLGLDPGVQIGADLLANAEAAYSLHGENLLIIDAGTATTIQLMLGKSFQGGLILPGMKCSAEALMRNAEKLSEFTITKPKQIVGKNTGDCINAGLFYGHVGALCYLVSKLKCKHPNLKIIATGGTSHLLANDFDFDYIHLPDLTLIGIRLIYSTNRMNVI
jgi:type III pantothenate kinase